MMHHPFLLHVTLFSPLFCFRFANYAAWGANAVSAVVSAVTMIVAGGHVARGEMTIASLVVFISTIVGLGPTIGAAFGDLFSIYKGFADIQKVASLLNSDTRRKQLLRGQEARKRLVQEKCAEHMHNLVIHDLTYVFKGAEKSAFPAFNANIDGGQIVAIKGGGSSGKRIALRLMARHYEPTTGFIHFPPFWRYRFLDPTPIFFGGDIGFLARIKARGGSAAELLKATQQSTGTIDYNVKFGAQFKHPDPGKCGRESYIISSFFREQRGN